jgi:glutamate--cysteine ligase
MLAVPALAKGVFYEADCLQATWDLVKTWSWDERMTLYHDVHRQTLQARIRRLQLAEIARELVAIAIEGLHRQGVRNAAGQDESIYLEQLEHQVRRGRCPADAVIENWTGAYDRDINRLIAGSAYRIAA